jgi:hypothetical protein
MKGFGNTRRDQDGSSGEGEVTVRALEGFFHSRTR